MSACIPGTSFVSVTRSRGRKLAELAGFDAFLAGFIKKSVRLGLKIFLFFLQSAHLNLDGLTAVSLVELDAARGRGRFTLAEIFQVNKLLVGVGDLLLQFIELFAA